MIYNIKAAAGMIMLRHDNANADVDFLSSALGLWIVMLAPNSTNCTAPSHKLPVKHYQTDTELG